MEDLHLVKRCEICGDVGWEGALVTCSNCKTTTEHMYCMRENCIEKPEVWYCEYCNLDLINRKENFLNPPSNAVMQGGFTKSDDPGYKRRPAKVKYLSVKEVMKLSSGATPKLRSPPKSNLDYRSGTSVTPKFTLFRLKPKRTDALSRKSPQHGGTQFSSMFSQQTNRTSKERRATFHHANRSSCKEQESTSIKTAQKAKTCIEDNLFEKVNVPMSIKEMDTVIVDGRKFGSKTSCSQPSRLSPPIGSGKTLSFGGSYYPDIDSKKPEIEVEERHKLTTVTIHSAYRPSAGEEEIWKGGFKFSDTSLPREFYGGFMAHPVCRLSREAYEFASTMPIILQVVLLPRDHVWAYSFQNDHPNLGDIALYFFPSANVESSKKNYANLFELLEANSSVMISCIGDIELLIFTSNQLHVDSLDVAERSIREQFLWAIFRQSKDKIPQHNYSAITECNFPIDMEIDMEGGQPLGRVDVVVSEKTACGKHVEASVDNSSSNAFDSSFQQLRRSAEQTQSNLDSLFSEAYDLLSAYSSKTSAKLADAGQELDCPPGFEEKASQKARSTVGEPPFDDRLIISAAEVGNIDLQVVKTEDKFEAEKLGQEDLRYELNTRSPGGTCWTLPPKGWIKLNVAGCLKEGKPLTAGGSGIIRDESGKWVHGYSLNSETALEAEFFSIYQGLVIAWEKGYRKVVVESESLLIVEHINKKSTAQNRIRIPMECCMNILKRDWECKFVLILRDANLSATWLATHFDDHPKGLNVFKKPPDGLVHLLQNDSWAMCPPLNQCF